jgi:hypothetical protein
MEELKNVKISDLTTEQIESRKQYLLTLSIEETSDYLLYLLDEEYDLGHGKDNKVVQDFLADQRFEKFRYFIMDQVDDGSDVYVANKVSSAPRKIRKKNKKIREKEKARKKAERFLNKTEDEN